MHDLFSDLSDGRILIRFLEIISSEKLGPVGEYFMGVTGQWGVVGPGGISVGEYFRGVAGQWGVVEPGLGVPGGGGGGGISVVQ